MPPETRVEAHVMKQGEKSSGSNGRKVALLVIAIAFIASATTAMLAFTASHHGREADVKALPLDEADLRSMLAGWQTDLTQAEHVSARDLQPYIDRLTSRTTSLATWKARTPCGQDARDRLHEAMEARMRRLARIQASQEAGNAPADEAGVLEAALGECRSRRGEDVFI